MKTEKYLILKMAELLAAWEEPHDSEDRNTQLKNAPIEQEYKTLKKMLQDHWAGKF